MPLAGGGRSCEDPSAGSNEGSGGRLAGSGMAPRLAPELPAVGGGAEQDVLVRVLKNVTPRAMSAWRKTDT